MVKPTGSKEIPPTLVRSDSKYWIWPTDSKECRPVSSAAQVPSNSESESYWFWPTDSKESPPASFAALARSDSKSKNILDLRYLSPYPSSQ